MSDLPTGPVLQIMKLAEQHVAGLCALLAALDEAGEGDQFRPHAFDRVQIAALATERTSDLYYVVLLDDHVAGYGLLRGWEEGYAVPSLGIAVHPEFRGMRIGDTLMQFLHAAARVRGSRRVRLRVVSTNTMAIRLYERSGYQFESDISRDAAGQPLMTGFKDLGV